MTFALSPSNVMLAPIGSAVGRGKRLNTWWSSDKIVCTCNRSTWLCRHVYKFLLDGDDIGKHTVISSTTEGRTFTRHLPVTNEILVGFQFTIMAHPADPKEFVIFASEDGGEVQAILTREDGLITLVNALRDYYSRVPEFHDSFQRIIMKKRLNCPRASHGHRNDLDLVGKIKAAIERLDPTRSPGDEDIVLVAEEIALGEAYNLRRNSMCASCFSFTDYTADVPEI